MLDRETHAAAPTFGEPPNLRHGRLQLLPQTYAAAPTYADLRPPTPTFPDLTMQRVWANVFLEEAEEEVEYNKEEGNVEDESEEGD